jgi:hypothetical protein
VTVDVRSVDFKGVPWVSSTSFKADSAGRLDLGRAAALGGSYHSGATYHAANHTIPDDEQAREELWPHLLAFLTHL